MVGLFGKGKKIEELQAELEKAKKEAEAAKSAKAANTALAEKKAEKLQAQLDALKAKDRERVTEKREKILAERKEQIEAAKKPEVIKEHTVEEGETLSHVALKYYGSATPPYWKFLLEHNTEVLKGNERNVRTGMKLEIPELPDDLKK